MTTTEHAEFMDVQKPHPRRALGRGLDSLLPSAPPPAAAAPTASGTNEIAIELIDRNPYQTRLTVHEEGMQELAKSIAANGVLQPIVVRPKGDGRFQLIAGARRLGASILAGKTTIPATVRAASESQAMVLTIIENLHREDLNPMEQAKGFERLQREFAMTQEQIAEVTNKDRATVANFLRLLKLPTELQQMVASGLLSAGHAKAILALRTPEQMSAAAARALQQSMSVRRLEEFVQDLLRPAEAAEKKEKPVDPNVRAAEERLRNALGMRVTIADRKGKGRVVIEYSDLNDFDTLMQALARE
jgi:ParB family chromosome partitioning protein